MNRSENWHIKEKKNNRRGLFTSLVIHGLLALLLVLVTMSMSKPEDQIQGVLIDFGTSQTGAGENIAPQEVEEIVEETQPQEVTPAAAAETSPITPDVADEVVTQDFQDAPAIEPEKEDPPKPTPEEIAAAEQAAIAEAEAAAEQAAAEAAAAEQAAQEQAAQDLKDQLDQAWNNTGDGGDGNTTGNNDQGVPDGVVDGPYNDGTSSTGLGDSGIGYDLGGRKMVSTPTIVDKSQQTGKVAILVKVDRNGKVISATYSLKGSTTSDSYLVKIAKEAAMKAKFESDSNAPSEQTGRISFNFTLAGN